MSMFIIIILSVFDILAINLKWGVKSYELHLPYLTNSGTTKNC